ncbi:MAG: glycosyltransferase [Burkholderiales bacterium]
MPPVLSFCIPTFNRCENLQELLKSIASQAVFLETDKVEIVVGDNCSSDGTEEVVRRFQDEHGNKIRYFRNESNVVDLNFERVLCHGTGSFLKLLNDRVTLRGGVVDFLLQLVETNLIEKPVLFSLNKQIQTDARVLVCANLNDLLAAVSYHCTWIGAFGIWREDLEALPDFSRQVDLQLVQVDALFRQMAPGKRCLILNEVHYHEQNLSGRKGGYSVAKVFGKNYLFLLRQQMAAGALSPLVFDLEKKRLLLEHILPYYFSTSHDFVKGRLADYLVDYLADDYFYQELERYVYGQPVPAYADLGGMQKLQRQWRLLNAHNEISLTYFSGPDALHCISAGNGSYGSLRVWAFGNPDEGLRIGHYCSIAPDTSFILGGNHDYETVSTYPFRVKNFGEPFEATTKGPVLVGDDVWIGHGAMVMSGVSIGQGAIVAAGSVVTKNVEPYCMVGGNPARHLKFRFAKEVRDKLLTVDYSKISPARLGSLRSSLREAVDSASVDRIVAALRG